MFGINLERENQKKEETEKEIREKNFYNSYYIINTTGGCQLQRLHISVEGVTCLYHHLRSY